jgi:hypothetical protein
LYALFRKQCYLSVFVEQAFQCGTPTMFSG